MDLPGAALGYQQITVLSAAVGLTVPDGASRATVQAEAQNVRFRDDGTNPSATVGFILYSGGSMNVAGASMRQMKFFEAAGGAILNVLYYT